MAESRFPRRERRQTSFGHAVAYTDMLAAEDGDEHSDANTVSVEAGSSRRGRGRGRGRRGRGPRNAANRTASSPGISSAVHFGEAAEDDDSDAPLSRLDRSSFGAAALKVQEGHHVHGNELYCICRRPYNPRMFMIGCDRCDGWFHAACVSISINEARRMESYTCPNCCKRSSATASSNSSKKRKRKPAGALPAGSWFRDHNPGLDPADDRIGGFSSHLAAGYGSGRSGSEMKSMLLRFSDVIPETDRPGADTDVYLTSDEDDEVPCEGSAQPIKQEHVENADPTGGTALRNNDFGSPDDWKAWQALSSEECDNAFLLHMIQAQAQCECALVNLEVQRCYVVAGRAIARRLSYQMRLDNLAELDGTIDMVIRVDPHLSPLISPGLQSIWCLRCKGDVPSTHFSGHMDRCLDIEPLPAKSLNSCITRCFHRRDDMWADEDDWNEKAPLLACGYPLSYGRLNLHGHLQCSDKPPPISTEYCSKSCEDCIDHIGWQSILAAEISQYHCFQKRRLEHLNAEIEMVRERLKQRNLLKEKSTCVSKGETAFLPNVHCSTNSVCANTSDSSSNCSSSSGAASTSCPAGASPLSLTQSAPISLPPPPVPPPRPAPILSMPSAQAV